MRWPDDKACGRCAGSGMIRWDDIYTPNTFGAPKMGPCIRCRPADFCEKIGLKREALQLRAREAA